MRHIISIQLQNEAGALSRVASLFARRGYNIESLTVAPTDNPSVSRITLVTEGGDEIIEQITKQASKLIDVIHAVNITTGEHIERELLILKASVEQQHMDDVANLVNQANARILDEDPRFMVIELSETSPKLDQFIGQVGKVASIKAVVRSGAMAVARGERSLAET